jgi:hypothetical protein
MEQMENVKENVQPNTTEPSLCANNCGFYGYVIQICIGFEAKFKKSRGKFFKYKEFQRIVYPYVTLSLIVGRQKRNRCFSTIRCISIWK